MSFSSFVSRVFGRRPVWLYRLEVDGVSYHLTSKGGGYETPNNRPTTEFPTGQVWLSCPIVRGELFQTSQANRTDTWVRIPTLNASASAIIHSSEVTAVKLTIWQGFIGDPDNEFVMQFSGRVVEVEADMLLTTLVCETSITEGARSSVAQVVQRPCRHAHYFTNADGGGCGLDLAAHQQSAEVTTISGRVLTVPLAAAQSDGVFLAGILEYDAKEYMIQSHIGEVLTLENEPPGLSDAVAAGATNVLIAPGCNLTIENCDLFNNRENHGGFPDMDQSEFDGRSIA